MDFDVRPLSLLYFMVGNIWLDMKTVNDSFIIMIMTITTLIMMVIMIMMGMTITMMTRKRRRRMIMRIIIADKLLSTFT